ncbi:hypothetical protein HNY73_016159 [Argiope bruennichi]|uniref:Uncharacterized protein n=1 Tax=Argiope bruennichi TaxID=94029 RepID=A0A8T0EI32_ARGBR|nr:hypothetical protein HNY73_016159 [Argiope bruennichi]
MVLLALLFSCMIAGSLACTDDHCKDPDLANELLKVQFLPNREELIYCIQKSYLFLGMRKRREILKCPGNSRNKEDGSDALELACIIDNLGDSCGDVATKTAVTVLERMKAFLKEGSCNDVENAADLKAKFLDFLDFEEPKRSSVKEIFDFLKKRR